jgi:hypothetical protein
LLDLQSKTLLDIGNDIFGDMFNGTLGRANAFSFVDAPIGRIEWVKGSHLQHEQAQEEVIGGEKHL